MRRLPQILVGLLHEDIRVVLVRGKRRPLPELLNGCGNRSSENPLDERAALPCLQLIGQEPFWVAMNSSMEMSRSPQ